MNEFVRVPIHERLIDQDPAFQMAGTKRYLRLKWVAGWLIVEHSDSTDLDSFVPVKRND